MIWTQYPTFGFEEFLLLFCNLFLRSWNAICNFVVLISYMLKWEQKAGNRRCNCIICQKRWDQGIPSFECRYQVDTQLLTVANRCNRKVTRNLSVGTERSVGNSHRSRFQMRLLLSRDTFMNLNFTLCGFLLANVV